MSNQNRSRRRTPAERTDAVRRFLDSGQSAVAFCREEGISTPTLTRWRAELEAKPQHDSLSFVEVVPAKGAGPAARDQLALLTITTDSGARIDVADIELARVVIDAAMGGVVS